MTCLIDCYTEEFERMVNRQPFQMNHKLIDHSLFELPELMSLANRLAGNSIEYNPAQVALSPVPTMTTRTGMTSKSSVISVREANSWMVIKNVEQDPAYSNLLESCLDEANKFSGACYSSMQDKHGFIIILPPGAITPFHIDPEHNFLFQIRGSQRITIFSPEDRDVLPETALEEFFAVAHRNLELKKDYEHKANVYILEAGSGIHIPVTSPHWVKNGDEVSVSFSITFNSPDIERRNCIYKINSLLRKSGLLPVPPDVSVIRDEFKVFMFNSLSKINSLQRRLLS